MSLSWFSENGDVAHKHTGIWICNVEAWSETFRQMYIIQAHKVKFCFSYVWILSLNSYPSVPRLNWMSVDTMEKTGSRRFGGRWHASSIVQCMWHANKVVNTLGLERKTTTNKQTNTSTWKRRGASWIIKVWDWISLSYTVVQACNPKGRWSMCPKLAWSTQRAKGLHRETSVAKNKREMTIY